jgi:hypothetical protein
MLTGPLLFKSPSCVITYFLMILSGRALVGALPRLCMLVVIGVSIIAQAPASSGRQPKGAPTLPAKAQAAAAPLAERKKAEDKNPDNAANRSLPLDKIMSLDLARHYDELRALLATIKETPVNHNVSGPSRVL